MSKLEIDMRAAMRNHLELTIEFDNEKKRFWLPKDQTLHEIIEAIKIAQPQPFARALDKKAQYILTDKKQAAEALNDKDLTFLKLKPNVNLFLLPRETKELRLLIVSNGLRYTYRALNGMTIGIAKGKNEKNPHIDLSPFAINRADRISHQHGEFFWDASGQSYFRVLHPNGVTVDNERTFDNTSQPIALKHGMLLSIELINILIVLTDTAG